MVAPTTMAPSAAEQPAAVPPGSRAGGGPYSTPAARALATEHGLSLVMLARDAGTGRVSLADVVASIEAGGRRDLRSLASLSVQVHVCDAESYRPKLVHSVIQAVHAKTHVGSPDIDLGLVTHGTETERHVMLTVSQDLSVEGVQRLIEDAPEQAAIAEDVVIHDLSGLKVDGGAAPLGGSVLAFQAGSVREVLSMGSGLDQLSFGKALVLDLSVTYDAEQTSPRVVAAALSSIAERMADA